MGETAIIASIVLALVMGAAGTAVHVRTTDTFNNFANIRAIDQLDMIGSDVAEFIKATSAYKPRAELIALLTAGITPDSNGWYIGYPSLQGGVLNITTMPDATYPGNTFLNMNKTINVEVKNMVVGENVHVIVTTSSPDISGVDVKELIL